MPLEGGSRSSGPDVGTSVVDVRWVVLRYAHDLKRARKDQSYQWGTRRTKTSDAVRPASEPPWYRSGSVAPVLAGDGEHAPLDGVDRVAAAALDLEVGGGDGGDAGGERVGGPAAEGPAGLVDLPGRHADVAGDVGGTAATGGAHLDQLAGLLGEHGHDRHGVDPHGDRVPQQAQRLAGVAGHRGVGHPEAGRLDLAPVVGQHDLLVDDPRGVVDELLARCRELAHVLADGLDEGVHPLSGGLAPGPAELVGGEVGLVAVGLDGRGVDDPGPGALERVEHLLAARAALVQHDEGQVRLGLTRQGGEQVGLQLVVGLVDVVHDDALGPAEQRRARVQGQLTGGVGRGVEPDRLELGLGDLEVVEGLGHGALGEQRLGAGDEHVGRHPVVHRDVVRHGRHSATRRGQRPPPIARCPRWRLSAVRCGPQRLGMTGQIGRDDVVVQMFEISDSQIVAHRRASAERVDVLCAHEPDRIGSVDGSKVDAEPGAARGVLDAGVELRSREQHDAADGQHDAQVGKDLHRGERLRLLACVNTHVLRSAEATLSIPPLVVVARGTVGQGLAEVPGVERHAVVRIHGKHGHPPVDLTHRRGVPGVPVGMERKRDARGEVPVTRRCAQAWDIEEGVVGITAEIAQ